MWKKTILALLVVQSAWSAPKTWNEVEVQQLLAKQRHTLQQQQSHLENQRALFLQVESLLSTAQHNKSLSAPTLALVERLLTQLTDYPLKMEADWALVRAKMQTNQLTQAEIEAFLQRYPHSTEGKQLEQFVYQLLYTQQKLHELSTYAQRVPPATVQNQCRLFDVRYQLLAEQLQTNPEAEQAGAASAPDSAELQQLLTQFEQFWLLNGDFWPTLTGGEANYWQKNERLPTECHNVESYWRDQGLKTPEKVQQLATALFAQNAKSALAYLALNSTDPELNAWLNHLQQLLAEPQNLANFAETQPITEWNKTIIAQSFPRFVKTLAEQQTSPTFAPYQAWLARWQLDNETAKAWKLAYLSRLFDNEDRDFQQWRDTQIAELRDDNLTERRLRLAIWQQTPLQPWLALLSDNAQQKAEWRYWAAKSAPNPQPLWQALAQERGFYPMLAAQALGKPYQFTPQDFKLLDLNASTEIQAQLARIAELRALQRFDTAKTVWVAWLKALDNFSLTLTLAQYANAQHWYDLAVESTIQAKAWDYLTLRLPNAYSDWFDLLLAQSPIRKTFAMAIARQESAWNIQARSHANALGLMQMLPSTAKQTAAQSQLPYSGERNLLDPFKNLMLGTAHLAELNAKYPNNRILIAAAYNAGAHRVERWLARAGGKLAMDEFIASIPFLETRGYVQNVLSYDYYYQLLQQQPNPMMFSPEELRRY